MRGLKYLVGSTILGGALVLLYPSPTYSGMWGDAFRKGNQKTAQDIQKYNNWVEKQNEIDRKNPNRVKDIAGEVMEQSGVPGAREMIEVIDKGPNYQPPWKRK